ncbi:hypothetical protein KP509_16G004100 [Ceratopteris richardii]|nr:hypothetical protein KP509_16G004100 [Ceratopteris richardii]
MEFNTLKVSGGWNHQQWQEDGTTLLSTQQSYRLKNWVERMSLSNREADGSKSPATSEMEVQILNGCEKELVLRYLMSFLSLQQEKNVSLDLNHKIQHTKDQIALLETELKVVKQHNEREKVALEQLEEILEKHKKRVEKQHHWSESQSHYRQCLERIIRDTLHQSSVYKEKSRLNQAACTALLARIRSHRMSCDDAEQDLVKQCREREALEILAKPALMEYICRCLVEQGFLNHGSIDTSAKMHDIRSNHCEKHMDVDDEMCTAFGGVTPKLAQSHVHKVETHLKPVVMCMDTIPEEDEQKEAEEFPSQLQRSPLKRKVTCGGELDVHVDTFQRYKVERIDTTSQAPNAARDSLHNWEGASHHLEVNMQIDELLQEVLTLQDRTNEISADKYCEESEEQRVARLGKQNLDKWLQKLLLESSSKKALGIEKLEELHWKNGSNICYGHPLDAQKHDKVAVFSTAVTRVRAKKGLGRLFQRMSFRHDAKKKLKLLNEETNEALHDVQAAGIAQQSNLVCCNVGNHKANQADHLLSSTLNRIKVDDCLEHVQDMSAEWLEKSDELMMGGSGQNTDLSEEDDEAPNELDFVRRMRELRDEHATKQNKKLITTSESNKMADDVATREFESCHVLSPEKLEEKVKECSLAGFGKVSRSYSMRSSGSGGRWVLHTRKGSDVFPSTIMEGDHSGEEVEIVLQPSSSFRREHDVSQLHEFDADYPLNGSYGNMGLRASLRTCTRAWKRAMSKRNINYPGNIKQ